MNNQKLNILFVLNKRRINKKGMCTILCRLTFRKQRKEFATGLFVNPDYWNSKKQKAFIPNDKENLNNQLSLIKNKINQVFLYLRVNEKNFDVEDVYLKYKGKETKKEKTILETFKLHNERMKKQIGYTYEKGTLRKYVQTFNHLKEFIKSKYKRSDFLLNNIRLKFIEDFSLYLLVEKNMKQTTVNRTNRYLRKIIKFAISEEFLVVDPFQNYKPKKVNTKIIYLSADELNLIEKHTFCQNKLQEVCDLFIFCCYTGLAYQEMTSLTTLNIKSDSKGNFWIEITRKKTGKEIYIPLLPRAMEILKMYDYDLPEFSNQKFNSYLKEIADIVGINKRLTHHIARKTFATTVLLGNNVSMEVVSELLGHSSLQVTQKYYAKLLKSRINNELKHLKNNE